MGYPIVARLPVGDDGQNPALLFRRELRITPFAVLLALLAEPPQDGRLPVLGNNNSFFRAVRLLCLAYRS